MKKLGYNLTKQENKKLMEIIDTDGSGSIDFNEFLLHMSEKIYGNNS